MLTSMMRRYAAVLALGCASANGFAQEISPNQGVTGDWGGLRTRLYQDGVDFQLGFTTEAAYNVTGGDSNLLRNADQIALGVTFDFDKLVGLKGGKFQITVTDRNGQNLSADANLGTLMQVQEIYGRGNTWRWTQFWYDQLLFDGVLDVKLGRLGVGEDFMSFSCYFMNLSFCGSLPGNIVSTWYNWPVSQWATRLKVNVTPEWYAQIGFYNINPDNIRTNDVFKLNNPPGTIGTLIPVEGGWTPKLFSAGLPGAYRLGAWYDTSNQPNVFLAANGQPLVLNPGVPALTENSGWGWYAMAQQQVTTVRGDASRGLTVFANFVQADRDTATIDQVFIVGLFFIGPLDARPQDDIGFAVGRTHVNNGVAQGQQLQNANGLGPVAVQTNEYPFELYYTFNVGNWLALRPNLQYILHPGGTSENSNVVVLGLKASVKF
jgi:porin